MTPVQIRRLSDPLARAKEAEGYINRGRDAVTEVETIRNNAISELSAAGWSERKIAKELGLSPARVHQLRKLRR